MPQETNDNRTTGGAGTGATGAGTTRDDMKNSSQTGTNDTSLTPAGGAGASGNQGTGAAVATARDAMNTVATQAQQYGQKLADAASTAKDYVSDKVSVVGDKIKDLQNKDFGQITEDAKDYARQNPGQALLISAAAGFLIGLLIRSGRR